VERRAWQCPANERPRVRRPARVLTLLYCNIACMCPVQGLGAYVNHCVISFCSGFRVVAERPILHSSTVTTPDQKQKQSDRTCPRSRPRGHGPLKRRQILNCPFPDELPRWCLQHHTSGPYPQHPATCYPLAAQASVSRLPLPHLAEEGHPEHPRPTHARIYLPMPFAGRVCTAASLRLLKSASFQLTRGKKTFDIHRRPWLPFC
jgi:hypothetical protein